MTNAAESTKKKAITSMKKTKSGIEQGTGGASFSQEFDARIKALAEWRGDMLARIRTLIMQADPEVLEEVKWRKPSNGMVGVPVWSHDGIICTGETYKAVVKLTFAKGASIPDPSGLFNSSLEGNTRRAIDFHARRDRLKDGVEGTIRAAVALSTSAVASARPVRSKKKPKSD